MRTSCVVWRIHDAKPGHVNQMRGLTDALAELVRLRVYDIAAPSWQQSLCMLASRSFGPGSRLPTPNLILGAGHTTHLGVLAARRARGGRAVILMRPTLPTRWFDLCLIPEHDQVPASQRVVITRGALNGIRPTTGRNPSRGLFLIGGPARSHRWKDQAMVQQVQRIVRSQPDVQWQLTTSRRTPSSFALAMRNAVSENLTVVSHEATDEHWVPQQLEQAAQVWVSEDSASMVYEALTSGAAVGVLQVARRRAGRVARGLDRLVREQWVTSFAHYDGQALSRRKPRTLYEAGRCAAVILHRLLTDWAERPSRGTPLSQASSTATSAALPASPSAF